MTSRSPKRPIFKHKTLKLSIIQQLNCWIIGKFNYCKIGFTMLIFTLVAAGCTGFSADEDEGLYIPPTRSGAAPVVAATATLPALIPTATPAALPTPACTDNLRYIEDLTIPDGSLVSPGEVLDKRWMVENNGSCNWDEGYRLIHFGGPDLDATVEQALFPARSGTQATIRILFTAPVEPGAYRSAWQAASPDGQAFGDPIFIEIQVEGS